LLDYVIDAVHIATCMSDHRKDLGLVIIYIEYLEIVITNYYDAFSNSHTLLFTAARTKSSQFLCLHQFLVMVSTADLPHTLVPVLSLCLNYQFLRAAAHSE
jgi:hypothetical protein